MSPDEHSDEPEHERPRPRVVDRRISARGAEQSEPERGAEAVEPEATPGPDAPFEATGDEHAQRLWTPEEEAEARRMAQQIAETPSAEWVVNVAVTLANVAGTKLDLGLAADAQLAIDALAGLINATTGNLDRAEAPLRQTLAQLQMAYAEAVSAPPKPP